MADSPRAECIDAHQHFWNLRAVDYPWLSRAEHRPIQRDFEPRDLEPLLRARGVDRTITVQAANSFADTDAMLARADRHNWIAAVTGWVPLTDPPAAWRALDQYTRHPAFRGVRHLVHDEPDPDWLARAEVAASLGLVAEHRLVFEVPAVFPRHLGHLPRLADALPALTIVIDHLGKPPIAGGDLCAWAAALSEVARRPNVYAKVSGLATEAPAGWSADDLRRVVEVALECFGEHRLMLGSDWPVCLHAGDYEYVWQQTAACVPAGVREAVLGGTAASVYRLSR